MQQNILQTAITRFAVLYIPATNRTLMLLNTVNIYQFVDTCYRAVTPSTLMLLNTVNIYQFVDTCYIAVTPSTISIVDYLID